MYTIHWTTLAENTYEEEIEYILSKWPFKEVEKFIILVEDSLQVLKMEAFSGKLSHIENVRILVVSKQTSLAYKIFKEDLRIELLTFWNNKIDPIRYKEYLNHF